MKKNTLNFYKFYDWAAYSLGGYTSAKMAVFSYLYSFHENEKPCFPSYKEIADRLGIGEATAKRAIAELVKIGIIQKHSPKIDGGCNFRCSNEYEINDAKVWELKAKYRHRNAAETTNVTAAVEDPDKAIDETAKAEFKVNSSDCFNLAAYLRSQRPKV